jgi:hypothetical protein
MKNFFEKLKIIVGIGGLFIFGYLISRWIVRGAFSHILLVFIPIYVCIIIGIIIKTSTKFKLPEERKILKTSFYSQITPYFILFGVIFIIIILNKVARAEPTLLERILASSIIFISFIPIFIYFTQRGLHILFLPIFSTIYSAYYAIPIFLLHEYNARPWFPILSHTCVEKALFCALLGLIVILISYYMIANFVAKKVPKINISLDTRKATIGAILLYTFGTFIKYGGAILPIPVQFGAVIDFIASLSLFGIGILFVFQLQGRLHIIGKILLWGMFLPLELIIILGKSELLAQSFIMVLFIFMIYCTFRRKIPWFAVISIVVIATSFVGIRKDVVKTIRQIPQPMNVFKKGVLFLHIGYENLKGRRRTYSQTIDIMVRRLAFIMTFGHVISLTPKEIPYWRGKTYQTIIWSIIPRIIFPYKPTKELGQSFGHRYGLLDIEDTTTSYNFPQLIEMYANFGIAGIIIGMFILGIIYRLIYELFSHPNASEGSMLIGIFIFAGLLNIESDFSLVFGAVFYHIILLLVISRFIRVR